MRLRVASLMVLLALTGCGGGDLECGGPFCVVPPGGQSAARLRAGEGNGQTGAPGRELPQAVEVVVTDADDRPVPDVEVGFSVTEGGGTVSAPAVRTDYQGRARVTWTLGNVTGSQAVQAEAAGASGTPLDGSPLVLSAEAVAPAAARVVLRQPPPDVVRNGEVLARQPVVEVLDAADQPVAQAEVRVTVSAGATLGGTTALVTDAAGRATFTDLAVHGVAGERTLRFGVTGTALETLATVRVGAGAPARITGNDPLTYQATVRSPVSPAPSVVVLDDADNAVPGAAVTFTPDRDATVSPATVTTDEFGAAQVTSWTLGETAGVSYTLTASIGTAGVAPVVFTADARPGMAGRLQITVQPSETARSGEPLARQPAIQVVDQSGNPISQSGMAITATISSGPAGTLQGGTATTNGSGRATFGGLIISGLAGTYTLSFSSPTLAGVTSTPIALSAGDASRIALAEPLAPTARSRVPLPVQPVVQLQDGRGNPVAQAGVTVAVSIASGGGTLLGATSAMTDAAGRAAFSGLAISGAPGGRTLRFSSTSPSREVVSGTIQLPRAAGIALVVGPPAEATVGTRLATPASWTLTDGDNLPVADVPVTFVASPGNTVEPASATSGDDGTVRLDGWTLPQTAGKQVVELRVPDAGVSKVSVLAVPGAAVRLDKISGDGQSAPVGSQLPEPLVVRALDQFGNGTPGVTVQWRTCDGAGQYDLETDPGGFASAAQDTGLTPGGGCVTASALGADGLPLSGSPVQFTFTTTSTTIPPE